MTGSYPGGMTDATLLPDEEECICNGCEYELDKLCPFKNDTSMCSGEIEDIENIIQEKLDDWCIDCDEEKCEYKDRVECYLEGN